MFARFKNVLRHPKFVLLYVRDSFFKVFTYLLLMALLLSLPIILIAFTNKDALFPNIGNLKSNIRTNMFNDSLVVENNKLINNEELNISFSIDTYTYVIGKIPANSTPYVVVLESETVSLYTIISGQYKMLINEVEYTTDFKFNEEGLNTITSLFTSVTNDNQTLVTSTFFTYFLVNLFELIALTMLMALFGLLMKHIPLKYGVHYKLAVYLITPYVILNLILMLFGLEGLTFISVVVYYIYHSVAYKSVRMVSGSGVNNKNEE